ncbi:hypothetical protein IIC65_07520, partial [Candidatus Sumerlaeota bacterium]|nr:hypothetical protein [Candidatus Sumerlaeota bacterium]
DWTSGLRRLGEEDAQVVTMSRWPVRLRFARTAGRRSATDILGPGVYDVAGANNALNPEQAIDTKLTSTAARLADGTGDLAFTIAAALGSEGTLLGRWSGASLRVRYSATKLWAPGSQLNLAFKQGASTFQASVPRPDPSEAQGQVEAPPGQEGDMVDTSLGIHEFEIDLAGAIAESTGWDALDVSPPTEMRVEFVADVDDDTVVFVHDLQLFVSYFAQLTAEPARTITARVEGWMDGAQEVIENPADVIELLLTDSRFAGLGSGEIDAADLSAIRSELASKGFTYARRIGGGQRLGDLIESAARESAVWIQSGGEKAGLARRGVSPPVAGSPETLDDTKSLDASAPARIVTPRGEVLSDCFTVVAGGEATGGEPKVWSRCADGSQGEGSIPEETALAWLDGREEGALAQLGGRILSAGREPEVGYTQSYPLGAIVLEPGDSVCADRAVVGLNAMPAWVESARTVSGSRVEIKMRGPEAGEFCWQEDGETFLRVFGFGARVTAYSSGLAMVSVEQGGRFVLRGRFREEANFSAGPFSGAVVHSGGFLYWSLGSGGSFTPFLRIDGAGNVDLNGTLREESALAFLIDGQCLSADATLFRLSPQGSEAALEFTGGVLHLAGRMAEDLEL